MPAKSASRISWWRWKQGIEPAAFRDWLDANRIAVLNVAGPRESKRPGVYEAAVLLFGGVDAGRVPARGRPLYTPCALPESGLPHPFTVGA